MNPSTGAQKELLHCVCTKPHSPLHVIPVFFSQGAPRTHAYHFHVTDQAGELRCTAQAAAFVYRRQVFSVRMEGKLRGNRFKF